MDAGNAVSNSPDIQIDTVNVYNSGSSKTGSGSQAISDGVTQAIMDGFKDAAAGTLGEDAVNELFGENATTQVGEGDYPMPEGMSSSKQGDYQRELGDIKDMAEDLMTSIIEDNIKREARGSGEVEDEKEGKPGDGGNAASGSTGGESGGSSISMGDLSGFMQLFAKMAEILGEKAGQMAQAVEDLQNAGGEGQEGAQEFAKQQALMQGFTKQFGMMNAAVTNFGKTMGDEGARAVGE